MIATERWETDSKIKTIATKLQRYTYYMLLD